MADEIKYEKDGGGLKIVETKSVERTVSIADVKANRAIYVQQIAEATEKYTALIEECDAILAEAEKLGLQ